MWKPLVRCSIVGGVIVYLWTMLAWTVMPFHKMSMNRFENQSEAVNSILDSAPQDGIYVAPFMDTKADSITGSGPFIFASVKRGVDFSDMTRPMIAGLLTQIAGAFLITLLLLRSKAMRYWSRVWFVTIVGLIVAILGLVPAWNWWHFPNSWLILGALDYFIGWFLGGLVIGKLVKD